MSVEEHEEIPWAMLVDQEHRSRSRMLYLVAAAILIVVVAVAAVRWVDSRRHGELPAAAVEIVAPTTLPPVSTTALLSEADLVGRDDSAGRRAAIVRAEWFVTDYFTMDGSPAPELIGAFPNDATLPELPQLAGTSAVSYVEWARAYAARSHEDGYVVTVVFRTLYENEEQRYERSPVRAVDVIVLVDDHLTAIGDLPIPVEPPTGQAISGWMHGTGEVADADLASSLEYAGRFTTDPALLESGAAGLEWRVVFTVEDPSGALLPMVMRSDVDPER